MRIRFVLVADAANTTSDGSLNILGIFNRISVPKCPAVHPKMDVIVSLALDEGDDKKSFKVVVEMLSPNLERAAIVDGELSVKNLGEVKYVNVLLPLVNTKFEAAGVHQFVVSVGDSQEACLLEIFEYKE